MIRNHLIGVAAMALVVPVAAPAAQVVAPAPGAPASQPAAALDPARIAAARLVIDRLWPLGTYRRAMDGTMSKMVDAMMDQMFAMKANDIAPDTKGKAAGADEPTMGAAMAAEDPYFRERMQLSTKAMFDAMMPLLDKIEPSVRDGMVRIYARKFSVEELRGMDGFFATPAGQAYAREWLLSFMDPEIVKGMQGFVPEMMKEMPAIMKKVEAATAHLPPAPKTKVTKP